MIELIRRCPDCGQDRRVEQHHPQEGGCSDAAGGYCPEWLCVGCGAGFLIGFIIPRQREQAQAERPRRLVA